jgi:hypothetical protein
MAKHPTTTLTYFDARGRAQYLRYYLRYRDVQHDDDRVQLSADFSAWLAIRGDRTVVGPFHKLPVLHWGGQLIAETAVIHAFLHKTLGDQARLSEEENLRHEMLASSLQVDVMLPIGTLIWADVAYAGVDLAALTKRTAERLRGHLASLNRTLDEWQWLERAKQRPVMLADCLLWEEISVAQHVFGDHLRINETPTLARFYEECPAQALFASILGDHPCQITGRPAEASAIAKIHELLG